MPSLVHIYRDVVVKQLKSKNRYNHGKHKIGIEISWRDVSAEVINFNIKENIRDG